jgi:hypothetical protein
LSQPYTARDKLQLAICCLLLALGSLSLTIGQGLVTLPTLAQSSDPVHSAALPRAPARSTGGDAGAIRRVNAPYFDGDVRFSETAISWFGRVNSTENHADVRVGYNDEYLRVIITAFDRYLWYDTSPGSDLNEWDGATLYLDLNADGGDTPAADDYRFVAQINRYQTGEDRADYQMAFRGNGSGWATATVPFTTASGWRGTAFNDNSQNDKGWALNFFIPFTSLGLSGPPADGTRWGMALTMHDRDNAAGSPPIADKRWPEAAQDTRPATWGQLAFNLPVYQPPPALVEGFTTIRQGLDGATVTDASVGGYTICGSGTNVWTEWGDTNEAFYNPERSDFNIQNQSDVADFPCFSRYYVIFPLDALPAGKVIISATLTLHQFGNAGGGSWGEAEPSLIQVLTVAEDWDEETLTWNNAPLAVENVASAWVDPLSSFPGWPGVPREWDVSRATAQAYAAGLPLRLALYEADSAYHSGKYFVSSNTGDWNDEGRPTLTVTWGQPQAVVDKQVWPIDGTNGETVTYTLSWLGTGQPLHMTDSLPDGLAPGRINASSGDASYDPDARQVTWTGTPAAGQAVTVTFPVTIQVNGPLALRNTAILTASGAYASSDTAVIFVDGYHVYLPLVRK